MVVAAGRNSALRRVNTGPSGWGATVSDAAWERMRSNPSAPRASFLSMLDWKEQWIDGEKFPFTPSVVDMHGIEACCDVVLAEGLDSSIARHELCGRATRAPASRRRFRRISPAQSSCISRAAPPRSSCCRSRT